MSGERDFFAEYKQTSAQPQPAGGGMIVSDGPNETCPLCGVESGESIENPPLTATGYRFWRRNGIAYATYCTCSKGMHLQAFENERKVQRNSKWSGR